MDKEVVEHIFEPFYTTKEPGKGTGLGLPMVYGIVKSHGGYITCHSEPGQGTTFRVYFPVLETEVSAADSHTSAKLDGVNGGNETILLADDEEVVRGVGEEILKRFGYKVITASSGKECIEIYKNKGKDISLVILDMIMPGMDGRQCLRELLRIDPEIKVIIASGYSAGGTIREMSGLGAQGFIGKPYRLRSLLTTVRQVLDGSTHVENTRC